MKLKKTLIMATIILIICFGTIAQLGAEEAYNLSGEWDAVITWQGIAKLSRGTTNDIVRISQQGDKFVGIKTIGGKFVGKNEEIIKGQLLNRMVDEAFMRHCHIATFDLSWIDGRAIITEEGNKIVLHSFGKSSGIFQTITLIRK